MILVNYDVTHPWKIIDSASYYLMVSDDYRRNRILSSYQNVLELKKIEHDLLKILKVTRLILSTIDPSVTARFSKKYNFLFYLIWMVEVSWYNGKVSHFLFVNENRTKAKLYKSINKIKKSH